MRVERFVEVIGRIRPALFQGTPKRSSDVDEQCKT